MKRLLVSAGALVALAAFVIALSAYNRAFHPRYHDAYWEPY